MCAFAPLNAACCALCRCLPMCGFVSGNRARLARAADSGVLHPTRRIHIRRRGRGESCRNRLTLEGSARLRPETKPRSASSGAGQTAHAFVSPFGEKRDSSRALHPPSAARYFVGGIPPPRLARVLWRITRTVAAPFPCARSSHMRRLPDLPLRRVCFRSLCARRLIVGSLN